MKKIFLIITILALLFLSLVAGYFAYTKATDKCVEQNFIDSGMGLNFNYSCDWKLELNTNISSEFVFDEEQELFGPVAENYELRFTNTESESEITFSKFLQAGDGSIRSFDEDDNYEILSDNLVRFETEDIWSYVEYYSCEDVPEIFRNGAENCGSSFFPTLGKFATVVSTQESDNTDLEQIDELVLEILD